EVVGARVVHEQEVAPPLDHVGVGVVLAVRDRVPVLEGEARIDRGAVRSQPGVEEQGDAGDQQHAERGSEQAQHGGGRYPASATPRERCAARKGLDPTGIRPACGACPTLPSVPRTGVRASGAARAALVGSPLLAVASFAAAARADEARDPAPTAPYDEASLDDEFDRELDSAAISDLIEPVNRKVFAGNRVVDRAVLDPITR